MAGEPLRSGLDRYLFHCVPFETQPAEPDPDRQYVLVLLDLEAARISIRCGRLNARKNIVLGALLLFVKGALGQDTATSRDRAARIAEARRRALERRR